MWGNVNWEYKCMDKFRMTIRFAQFNSTTKQWAIIWSHVVNKKYLINCMYIAVYLRIAKTKRERLNFNYLSCSNLSCSNSLFLKKKSDLHAKPAIIVDNKNWSHLSKVNDICHSIAKTKNKIINDDESLKKINIKTWKHLSCKEFSISI